MPSDLFGEIANEFTTGLQLLTHDPRISIAFSSGLIIGLLLGAFLRMFARVRFKAIAWDVLRTSNEEFLQLAENRFRISEEAVDRKTLAIDEMIKPVQDTVQKMDVQLKVIEAKREDAYRGLWETTQKIDQMLKGSSPRGEFTQIQFERILEMTGMSKHATRDFADQLTLTSEEEGSQRPDFIVFLPGGRCIVVDCKAPRNA
jgi:DNA recombination protein RmuC